MSLVNGLWLSSYLSSGNDTADPKPDPEPHTFEPFNDSRDGYGWLEGIVDSPRPITGSQPVKLPTLFATSLPPAGYEVQIAFQNVVHRLRHLYIHLASIDTGNICPVELTLKICETISNHLINEEAPPNGLRRRQSIISFERKWASWFVKKSPTWSSMGRNGGAREEGPEDHVGDQHGS